MRDGEDVEEMKFVKVYRASKWLKISSAAGFAVSALMMKFIPAFMCEFNSSGITGKFEQIGVSDALVDIGSAVSYVIWLATFACYITGIVYAWNAKPKILPIVCSAFLTFATIFSSTLIKVSGKVGNFEIVKEYAIRKSFYLVLIVNVALTALTVVMMIKTKQKVEFKFESDK